MIGIGAYALTACSSSSSSNQERGRVIAAHQTRYISLLTQPVLTATLLRTAPSCARNLFQSRLDCSRSGVSETDLKLSDPLPTAVVSPIV